MTGRENLQKERDKQNKTISELSKRSAGPKGDDWFSDKTLANIHAVSEPGADILTEILAPLGAAKSFKWARGKFKSVKEVSAAAGVKVSAVGVENAVAGMPLIGTDNLEEAKETVKADVEEALIETDQNGIIVKADTLGSIEAVVMLLREKKVPIRKATVGKISKKDIAEADSNYKKDRSLGVVAGFNVELDEEAKAYVKDSNVKVITHDVVYKLIDDLEEWYGEIKKQEETEQLEFQY